jgi:hypothetical protein
MQNGQPPKLMIINIKTGAKEVDHELVAPGPAGPGGTHGQRPPFWMQRLPLSASAIEPACLG